MGYTQKVAVIGAGISGLACAYHLKQLGIPCLVLEARDRPGGVIATIRRNGFLFETGPQCPRFPLQAIEYAAVCAVGSAYGRSQMVDPLHGFGFMVPRREGFETICTFWNSSLFPRRAPEGKLLMTSFAGRNMSNDRAGFDEEKYAQAVEAENAKALGIKGPPLDRLVWNDSRALPRYNVGHARRVAELQSILRTMPNLRLAGNFLKGRSIGDSTNKFLGAVYSTARNVHKHSSPGLHSSCNSRKTHNALRNILVYALRCV